MSPYPPNQEAALQREIGGLRSDLERVHHDLDAFRGEVQTGFVRSHEKHDLTNGRLRKAEADLIRQQARLDERARVEADRERRLDRSLSMIKWGVTSVLVVLVPLAVWALSFITGTA